MAYDPTDDWMFLISKSGKKSKNKGWTGGGKQKIKKDMMIFIKNPPPVIMKITSFAKGGVVQDHLDYISRDDNVIKNDMGLELDDNQIQAFGDACQLNADSSTTYEDKRVTMNFMVTKPYGENTIDGFEENLINSLYDSFPEHSFVYALHDDSTVHAHVVVSYYGDNQKALNPDRDFLARIKDNFAEQSNKHTPIVQSYSLLSRAGTQKHSKIKDTGFQGKVVSFGSARYDFDDSKSMSFHLTLDNKGKKSTYWGVGLEKLLTGEKAIANIGDNVKLTRSKGETHTIGKKTVASNEWTVENIDKLSMSKNKKNSLSNTITERGKALLRLSKWAKNEKMSELSNGFKHHHDQYFSKDKRLDRDINTKGVGR